MPSHRPFHTATAFSKCHLSLACAYFCRTWMHVLHIKNPLGIYWVLYRIFLMKRGKKWRNELNWKIDPDRCHAIFTSGWSRAANTSAWIFLSCSCSFSSLLAYNVFDLVFCNFFICSNKPILKESSLYALLLIGVYTHNTITFPIFYWLCNKLEILSSFSAKSQMPGQFHC